MSDDGMDRRSGAAAGSVALFVDWDNFAIGLRQEMPDRPADVGPILRWSRRFGLLTVCRAYGEWRDPAERLAIYNAGVEVVYAPVLPLGGSLLARNGGGAKSLADTAMAVDVTELLSLIPTVSTVILATSDKDMIPVLRFAQRRGLQAIVVGSDRTAGALKELADRFISYRDLLDTEGATTIPQLSRPATVPPVRYPRPSRSGAASGLPAPTVPTPASAMLPAPVQATGLRASRPQSFLVGPGRTGQVATEVPPASRPLTSAGSVFATGEDEMVAEPESAARRRRRGGRRRRGSDAAAEPSPPGTAEVTDETAEDDAVAAGLPVPAVDRIPTAVAAAMPGEVMSEAKAAEPSVQTVPVAAATPSPTQLASEPTGEQWSAAVQDGVDGEEALPARSEPEAQPAPAAFVAPVARTPVVLPGERLRRFRAAEAAAEQTGGEAEASSGPGAPAGVADGAEARAETIPAQPAVEPVASTAAAEDGGAPPTIPAAPEGVAAEEAQPTGSRRRTTGRSRGDRRSGRGTADRASQAGAALDAAGGTSTEVSAGESGGRNGAAIAPEARAIDAGIPVGAAAGESASEGGAAANGGAPEGGAPPGASATDNAPDGTEPAAGAERQSPAPARRGTRRRGDRAK